MENDVTEKLLQIYSQYVVSPSLCTVADYRRFTVRLQLKTLLLCILLLTPAIKVQLTLKDMGGGADSAHWSVDHLPFLTGSYYGHKIS
jgi:hypothetical protein